ncbi:HAD hydrolase, family IA, variant 3 [Bacteroidales bacterium KA00344]|nr:HAD hydrolase, family IA, variant 3 [Bacteroidales bacterium KA00344]
MYKLIILDFDGTIGDTNKIIIDTMQATLRELKLPMRSREECCKTIGLPLKVGFRTMMPLTDEQNEECFNTYNRIFDENNRDNKVEMFPGVKEAIKQWHNAGTIITLASSRGNASLTNFVEQMQLGKYISLILGAEDVELAKPNPYPVLKTLKHFNIAPEDTLVVGDMSFDILMGKRAGCHTCAVTYGNGTEEELRAAGAEQIVDSFLNIK